MTTNDGYEASEAIDHGAAASPGHADEIERAIANVKRTAFDKWFRRKWYIAAAMDRRRSGGASGTGRS